MSSQDGVPQQQEAAPLFLPRLDHLFEATFTRDESSTSNAGVVAVPSQLKVTKQILLSSTVLSAQQLSSTVLSAMLRERVREKERIASVRFRRW